MRTNKTSSWRTVGLAVTKYAVVLGTAACIGGLSGQWSDLVAPLAAIVLWLAWTATAEIAGVRDLEDGLMKHRHCCDIEP